MLINCKTYSCNLTGTVDYMHIMCLDFSTSGGCFCPYSDAYYKRYTENLNVLCHLCLVTRTDDITVNIYEKAFVLSDEDMSIHDF